MTRSRCQNSYLIDLAEARRAERGLVLADCRAFLPSLPNNSVALTHTSPPYNIGRNYRGFRDRQDVDEYKELVRSVFSELHRATRPGGSVFWQVGYTTLGENGAAQAGGITALDCLSLPLAMEAGFVLWDRIIWSYYGSMAFQTKFTNRYETILWLTKLGSACKTPAFALDEVREKSKSYDGRNHLLGRNPGNVWSAERVAFGSIGQTSHVAVFPEEVSEKIVRSCSKPGDLVLDPFSGSGTLPKVALTTGRRFLGSEISDQYLAEADQRLRLWCPTEAENLAVGLLVKYVFHSRNGKASASKAALILDGFLSRSKLKSEIQRINEVVKEVIEAPRVTKALKARKDEIWRKYDSLIDAGDESSEIIAADRALAFCFAHRRRWNGLRRYLSAAQGLAALQAAAEEAPSLERYVKDLCQCASARFRTQGNTIECMRPDPGLGCNGESQPARSPRAEESDQMPLWDGDTARINGAF